jgi:hypothetical protein
MLSFATISGATAMARLNGQVGPIPSRNVSGSVCPDITGGTVQLFQARQSMFATICSRDHPCSCDHPRRHNLCRCGRPTWAPTPPPPPLTPPLCHRVLRRHLLCLHRLATPPVGRSFRQCVCHLLDEVASRSDDLGEAGVGPETLHVHD